MQRQGARWLSEEELNELVATHPEIAQLKHLDFGGRCLLNRTARGSYRFSHYSIQEFFLAQRLLFEYSHADQIVVPPAASENTLKFLLAARAKECPDQRLILRGANLARFNLKGSLLVGCDFSDADLTNADLTNADLTNANLTNACLTGPRLEQAVVTGANLTGVVLNQPVDGWPFSIGLAPETLLEMVWIPSGSFRRGDEARFEVNLAHGFWLGKYPVTQLQFSALAGNNPSQFKADPNAPVETVSWD